MEKISLKPSKRVLIAAVMIVAVVAVLVVSFVWGPASQ
ncbi:hypothetical protein TALC_00123 [Thermoplasmatales archaeon BRNA1]|nr:hypothetical protein TALC_00123 [Thermoplasmatales archaeon BRNA1]